MVQHHHPRHSRHSRHPLSSGRYATTQHRQTRAFPTQTHGTEGEDDRRDRASHRDKDSVVTTNTRRFGAAAGIMSSGSTHGIGPRVALPVTSTSGSAAAPAGVDMDVDDEDLPLSQSSKAKSKEPVQVTDSVSAANASASSNAMAVDPPAVPAAPAPQP